MKLKLTFALLLIVSFISAQNTTLICPPDSSYECNHELRPPIFSVEEFITAGGSLQTDCGIISSSFTTNIKTDIFSNPVISYRTFSIKDSCDNLATCVQSNILMPDMETPEFAPYKNIIAFASLEEIPPPYTSIQSFILAGVTISDNCRLDSASFKIISERIIQNTSGQSVEREYLVADIWGNTSSFLQYLKVNPIVSTGDTTKMTACENDMPYSWQGQTIRESGTYSDTLVNISGVDSILTLIIHVCPYYIPMKKTILDTELPFIWNGLSIVDEETYFVRLVTINGCDSILSMNLNVVDYNDFDNDGDNLSNSNDNCPNTYNPEQTDVDKDGIGDVCDDSDSDGIVDSDDLCPDTEHEIKVDENGCKAPYSIEGNIRYEQASKSSSGENLEGILILLTQDNIIIDSVYTDSSGHYVFYVFDAVEYSVEVNFDGYNQTTIMSVVVNEENVIVGEVNFTIWIDGTITNIDETHTENSFTVYPNPTNSRLFIQTSLPGEVLVFDMNGKLIINQQVEYNKSVINVSGLNPGNYLLKFDYEGGSKKVQFIKN